MARQRDKMQLCCDARQVFPGQFVDPLSRGSMIVVIDCKRALESVQSVQTSGCSFEIHLNACLTTASSAAVDEVIWETKVRIQR